MVVVRSLQTELQIQVAVVAPEMVDHKMVVQAALALSLSKSPTRLLRHSLVV